MSLFENLKPFMDAQVDDGLGDSFVYKIGGVAVATARGFLFNLADDGSGFGEVQPVKQRWRLKIRKSSIPARPSMTHEITAAVLEGPYKPVGNNAIGDDGAYWLVDLQKKGA